MATSTTMAALYVRTYVMVVRGKVVSISVAPGYHVYIAGGLALILSFGVKELT